MIKIEIDKRNGSVDAKSKITSYYHNPHGAAWVWANGVRFWKLNNTTHSTAGPAWVGAGGDKEYWVDGVELTEEEFNEKYGEVASE